MFSTNGLNFNIQSQIKLIESLAQEKLENFEFKVAAEIYDVCQTLATMIPNNIENYASLRDKCLFVEQSLNLDSRQLLRLAKLHTEMKDYFLAAPLFKKLAMQTNASIDWISAAECYELKGNHVTAAHYYKKAAQISNTIHDWMKAGNKFIEIAGMATHLDEISFIKEARTCYEVCIHGAEVKDTEKLAAWKGILDCAKKLRDEQGAANASKYCATLSNDISAWQEMFESYEILINNKKKGTKEYRDAKTEMLAALNAAINIERKNSKYWRLLARTHEKFSNNSDAEFCYEETFKLSHDYHDLLSAAKIAEQSGLSHEIDKYYAKAIALLEESVKLNSKNQIIKNELINTLSLAANFYEKYILESKALECRIKIAGLSGKPGDSLLVAQYAERIKNYKEAGNYYFATVKRCLPSYNLNPTDFKIKSQLASLFHKAGECYIKAGNKEDAEVCFRESESLSENLKNAEPEEVHSNNEGSKLNQKRAAEFLTSFGGVFKKANTNVEGSIAQQEERKPGPTQ